MDSLLAPAMQVLLDRAGDVTGLDVLDIGCGTGAVSLAFVEAGARVTATDISAQLLDRTAKRGAGRIATFLSDAQTADWPHLVDLAVSRFGVMFFADPVRAFANIAQALKPGGRMLFAAWGPFDENIWWHMPQGIAAARLGVDIASSNPHVPGPMGLADMEWALARLKSPALAEVRCEALDILLDHPGGADAAGDLATRLGPAARVLKLYDATEADRLYVARAIADALTDHVEGDGVRIPARIHLYSAQKH